MPLVKLFPCLAYLLLFGCKSVQLEPVKIDVSDLSIRPCDPKVVTRLPPEQRSLVCYQVAGQARNGSTRPLRNINLYGIIQDVEGTTLKEGRVGGLPDLDNGKSVPFNLRVFFTGEPRKPLKLEAFRAKGMT